MWIGRRKQPASIDPTTVDRNVLAVPHASGPGLSGVDAVAEQPDDGRQLQRGVTTGEVSLL